MKYQVAIRKHVLEDVRTRENMDNYEVQKK